MCTTEQGSSQDPDTAFRRSGESLFNQVQTYLKSTNPTGQNPNAGNTDQAGTTGEKKKQEEEAETNLDFTTWRITTTRQSEGERYCVYKYSPGERSEADDQRDTGDAD